MSEPVIRLDEKGGLDEVVADGVTVVHLERMDTQHWWLGITLVDGRTLHVWLEAKRAAVTGRVDRSEMERGRE